MSNPTLLTTDCSILVSGGESQLPSPPQLQRARTLALTASDCVALEQKVTKEDQMVIMTDIERKVDADKPPSEDMLIPPTPHQLVACAESRLNLYRRMP